ncbi:hypothetical protein [Piscinibacter defluvii]|uniref:hypothetical protein n=1 Tax=Piscinibacter defluvii TaxID=1796922 RepID=UPI001F0C74E8|nr:hypothetical protein [Piscinibacter defluvii]
MPAGAGQRQHLPAVDEYLARIADGRHDHSCTWIVLAELVPLPPPPAGRAEVRKPVLDRCRGERAVLIFGVLRSDGWQILDGAPGPPVAHRLELALDVLAVLQLREPLPGVTRDSLVNGAPRLGDAGRDRVQGRAFLAVVRVGLGSCPPNGEKATLAKTVAVDAVAELELEASPALAVADDVDRHDAR